MKRPFAKKVNRLKPSVDHVTSLICMDDEPE